MRRCVGSCGNGDRNADWYEDKGVQWLRKLGVEMM